MQTLHARVSTGWNSGSGQCLDMCVSPRCGNSALDDVYESRWSEFLGSFSIYSYSFPILGESDEVNWKWGLYFPVNKCLGDCKANVGLDILLGANNEGGNHHQSQLQSWIHPESPCKGDTHCSDGSAKVILQMYKQVLTGSGDVACSSPCSPWTLYLNDVEGPHKIIVSDVTVWSEPTCFMHA